jgi:hypothetical protein
MPRLQCISPSGHLSSLSIPFAFGPLAKARLMSDFFHSFVLALLPSPG